MTDNSEPHDDLAVATLTLDRAAFVASFPRWFLIVPFEHVPRPSVRFRTVECEDLKKRMVASDDDEAPFALKNPRWHRQPWTPVPLEKRATSPYPDRISIGRAGNVDVVIGSRVVSKLHAHMFLAPDQGSTINDLASQNGTFVNGVHLAPHKPEPIVDGDIISFGEVHCEFAASEVVYYATRRKYLLLDASLASKETRRDGDL